MLLGFCESASLDSTQMAPFLRRLTVPSRINLSIFPARSPLVQLIPKTSQHPSTTSLQYSRQIFLGQSMSFIGRYHSWYMERCYKPKQGSVKWVLISPFPGFFALVSGMRCCRFWRCWSRFSPHPAACETTKTLIAYKFQQELHTHTVTTSLQPRRSRLGASGNSM